jgi:hypothetical protein
MRKCVSLPRPFNLGLDMTRRIDDLLDEVRNAETLLQNARYLYYTLIKKKKKNFLIYKEIQKGAVAKSYMTNGLLIYD